MTDRDSSFGNMLLGMIVGGAVGYMVAMLYAPRPGEDTRQMLSEKSQELRGRASDTLVDTKEKANKWIDENRQKVSDTINQSKDRAKDVADQAVDKGTGYVTEKRVGVAEGLRKVADSVDPTTPDQPDNTITPSI